MNLTEYETTVVIRPDIGGDAVEVTLDRVRDVVKNGGGKLLAINHWGKKKLAFEIAKHSRGIYVHTHYLGKNNLVLELERNLRISDNVLRFLTIRLADNVAATERQEKAYERPQYEADDAAEEAAFGSDEDEDNRDDDSRRGRDRDGRDRDRDRDDAGEHDSRESRDAKAPSEAEEE